MKVLKDSQVNILSLSLADTTEYGLLRLIVDNPEKGKETLSANGFSTLLSNVLIIRITHEAGSLQGLLETLAEKQMNIEYMYGLSTEGNKATVVLKSNNFELAEQILSACGIKTLSVEELV